MANICWFEMRMRGSKENCLAMLNSGIPCYDARVIAENGTEEDYMMYVRGECRWSVTGSMVNVDEGETLAAKAARFQLELEVCGLDETGECPERFHYKGDQVLRENNLAPCLPICSVEDGDFALSEEELQKYDKDEDADMYVLKEEFAEHFTFDYERDEAVFDFTMSFRDLPGFEEYEESGGDEQDDDPFGSTLGILSTMGIAPDENGFALSYDEEDHSATLYGYFGTAKTVIVPDGVTFLEMGCFSDNETVEEIVLPQTLKSIGEDCFTNCPNLRKVVIPESVESMWEEDDTFEGCPNLTICTPKNSAADRIARAKNLRVVNEF